MRITREEAATLTAKGAQEAVAARSPVPEGWHGGGLTIFVQGRPWNPLNGGQRSYMKHARLRKAWRERTASRLLSHANIITRRDWPYRWPWRPATPKRITFTVYARNAFDSDNLEAVCKSVRDALKDAGMIQDDRPSAGHTFEYAQVPTRKAGAVHGIAVRIAGINIRRWL